MRTTLSVRFYCGHCLICKMLYIYTHPPCFVFYLRTCNVARELVDKHYLFISFLWSPFLKTINSYDHTLLLSSSIRTTALSLSLSLFSPVFFSLCPYCCLTTLSLSVSPHYIRPLPVSVVFLASLVLSLSRSVFFCFLLQHCGNLSFSRLFFT